MMDRLILAATMCVVGWNGLHPADPAPLTSAQLRQKGKEKSISRMCDKPRKSKTVKELCAKWEK